MEACGGSHFLGRRLRERGHEIRLIPAQHLKPYAKTNKNTQIKIDISDPHTSLVSTIDDVWKAMRGSTVYGPRLGAARELAENAHV
jgi:hypothetical protein